MRALAGGKSQLGSREDEVLVEIQWMMGDLT
jgi:hypothetical protein